MAPDDDAINGRRPFKNIAARLSPEVHTVASKVAARLGQSLNEFIVKAIEDAIRRAREDGDLKRSDAEFSQEITRLSRLQSDIAQGK